ncbi:MAG: hypothetical protein Kow0059_11490 [Candidatus Sumerlaeia bacterium]
MDTRLPTTTLVKPHTVIRRVNNLHPVFQGRSYHVGSRIEIDRRLPVHPEEEDAAEIVELFSEPPRYIERIAPLSVKIGNEVLRGKNYTDLMIRGYRAFNRIFTNIQRVVEQDMRLTFRERAMVPFMALGIDPDTLHRIIEADYEVAENTYYQLMEHISRGTISPCVTPPFHVLLPALQDEFDVRLCVRIGFLFYKPILKRYYAFVRKEHKEGMFVVPYWLPEGGFSRQTAEIIHEEFMAFAEAEGFAYPHLVFMLDNNQAEEGRNDVLMKSWNIYRLGEKRVISVLFKDRNFSDWVSYANPSVKKLLDRTIAKVDADLNAKNVDYCWSHFEDVEALLNTPKAAANFEQKIIKLTELKYLPIAPDVFVRRKMLKKFGRAEHEPMEVHLIDRTAWSDWHINNISLGRWEGFLDSNAEYKLVDENHPYTRRTKTGDIEEPGPQAWKIAFNRAMRRCADVVRGHPRRLNSGMLGVLAGLVPSKDKKRIRKNVEDFLVNYALVHWREHFIQHEHSESDINIADLIGRYLFADCRKPNIEKDRTLVCTAATAAQAIYFSLDGQRSTATFWENMDQRSVYQNVVMMSLAMVNAVYVYKWQKQDAKADEVVNVMVEELINFKTAYERYGLSEYGVREVEWNDSIKSNVDESMRPIVERAARRIGARHLRALGYKKIFSLDDEMITTNVGHIWSGEVDNTNFQWDNRFFCGVRED